MYKAGFLLIIGGLTLPAVAAADPVGEPVAAAEPAPVSVLGTNWTLKPKGPPGVQGPSVPPPPKVRKPRLAQRAAPRPAKQRVDNAPLVAAIKSGQRRNK